MVWKFQGRFDSKIDTKGRWSLPSGLKSEELETAPLVFTVAKDHGLNHLDVYDLTQWRALVRKVQALDSFEPEVQAFKRFYLSSGMEVHPDKLGRYLVPKALRSHAQLESFVVVVGMGEKIEVWSKTFWDKAFEQLTESSETVMAALGRLSAQKGSDPKKKES